MMHDHDRDAGSDQRTLVAAGALALAAVGLGGTFLWLHFGESVYIERILGAIASCF